MNGMADDQGQITPGSTVGGQTLDQLGLADIVARMQQIEEENQQTEPTPGMTYNPGQGGQANAPQRPSYGAPTQRPQLQMGSRQPQAMSVTAGRQNQSVNPYQNQDLTNMHNTSRRGLLDDLFGRGGGLL